MYISLIGVTYYKSTNSGVPTELDHIAPEEFVRPESEERPHVRWVVSVSDSCRENSSRTIASDFVVRLCSFRQLTKE